MGQVIIFSAIFFVVAVLPFYSTAKIYIVLCGNAVFYSCNFIRNLAFGPVLKVSENDHTLSI